MRVLLFLWALLDRGVFIVWALFYWGLLRALTPRPTPRAVRLRRALESLGPLFVKFGQVLSTRQDLLAADIAQELVKLQDRVPPFAAKTAKALIERSLGRSIDAVFSQFEETPAASASVAQVHFATLHSGESVAVKVLRPGLRPIIKSDLLLMRGVAWLFAGVSRDVRRLRPQAVIDEFEAHLHEELDLTLEAGNCVELGRQMQEMTRRTRGDLRVLIPAVFWDYCTPLVMVMQRLEGVPINRVDQLQAAGVDLHDLARRGILILYWQVFRNGFFHGDLHPGNVSVSLEPKTFGVPIYYDFGIAGTLTASDQNYLTQNFLAFFERDYQKVAQNHVDSGWVRHDVNVAALTNAIRAACEPQFGKPLKDISFGQVLKRLFETSHRFDIQIQPQLVLLQKTLMNVEGMGRQLDPNHDLWVTVKPFLQTWVREQVGLKGLLRTLKANAPQYLKLLPELPLLLHAYLKARVEASHAGSVADSGRGTQP